MNRLLSLLPSICVSLISCGPSRGPDTPVRVTEPNLRCDPGRHDLSIEEEIECLLSGNARASSVRLAIAPLEVAGDNDTWLGDAVATLIGSRMARYEGVSVLERGELTALIDELKRGEAQQTVAQSADKILGLQYMVLGQLIPESERRYRAVLRPVRVASSEIVQPLEFKIRTSDPGDDLDDVVQELRRRLALSVQAEGQEVSNLAPEALERASRAMQAKARGELELASVLYLEALPEVSSAFTFELDLIDLMEDLRLTEWAYERAKLLKKTHYASLSACHRTRLYAALADSGEDLPKEMANAVRHARDAVAYSKVCGDDALSAQALTMYARVLGENLDVEAAMSVLESADPLATSAEFVRCELEYERTWLLRYRLGSGRETPLLERWRQVEKICATAGHSVLELDSITEQSFLTPDELERVALLQRAYDKGSRIGGSTGDDAALRLSRALRESGQPVKAAKLVQDRIASVLATLMKLHGGKLAGPEAAIDKHLLSRMDIDVSQIGAAPKLSRMRALLVRGHRSRLSGLLEHWADHFEPETYGLADQYRAIARRLQGDSAPPADEKAEARLERELAAASTTLDEIEGLAGPPPRGSALNVAAAYFAFMDWFFALDADNHEQRRRAATLALKTATWLNSPVQKAYALRAVAIQKTYEACGSCFSDALVAIKEAASLVDDPDARHWYLEIQVWLLRRFDRDDEASPVKAEEIEQLRQISEVQWIDAVAAEARRLHGLDDERAGQYAESLAQLAVKYIEQERWWLTSHLLTKLSDVMEAFASQPIPESIQLLQASAEQARKVGDPRLIAERTAAHANAISRWQQARFGDRAKRMMAEDEQARRAADEAYAAVGALASAGQHRDALLQLLDISSILPGYKEQLVAIEPSLDKLRLSKRHPLYRGLWLDARALTETSARDKDKLWAEAAEAFTKGEFFQKAVVAHWRRVENANNGSDLLERTSQCVTTARKHGVDIDECNPQVYQVAKLLSCEQASNSDREQLATYMKEIAASREKWYSTSLFSTETNRAEQETQLAALYLLADDKSKSRQFATAASTRYEAARDTYSRAQLFDRLALASLVRCDYPALIEHTDAFLDSNGAGEYFVAYVLLRAYRGALIQGDHGAATRLKQRGERAARAGSPRTFADYAVTDAYLALRDKRFKDAADHLAEARARTQDYAPAYLPQLEQLRLEEAAALALAGQRSEARARLDQAVRALAGWSYAAEIPGSMAQRYALAATVANGVGLCDQASSLAQDARRHAKLATTTVQLAGSDHPWIPRELTWTDGPVDIDHLDSQKCAPLKGVNSTIFGYGRLLP